MTGDPSQPQDIVQEENSRVSMSERFTNPRFLILLLVASLLLLGSVALAAYFLLQPAPPPFTPPDSLESLAQDYPELATILQDDKLSSVYKEFLLVYQTQGEEAAYQLAKERGLINDRDEVRLTLELDTSDPAVVEGLKSELEQSGMRVTATAGTLVDLAIPLEVLLPVLESGGEGELFGGVSGLEHVVRIRLPSTIEGKHVPASQLRVEIESLSTIGADSWHSQGFTGQGVKVGILDLEFDGYRSLLGSELPDTVTAQCFCDGGQIDQMGGVHGTGVAEIIHDIAPDAELYLAAFQTDAEFQQAAEWLVSQGVQVISNSTGSNFGPKDGSSFSSGVIDSIVQQGVLWLNSAGNAADGHYRREFTDRDGDGWHDELIYFETFGSDSIALNWNAWSTGDQDYDLFIYDTNDSLVASSQDTQSGTFSYSAEFIRFDAPDDGKRYYAAVQSARTTGTFILDFFTNNGTVDSELISKEYSLDDEAASKLGLAIGAVYWGNDELESYSSQGPSNDGRLKPELSAPSVVSVESYGREGFNGTSAATPHVSGAAALILSAAPNFSVEQVKDYLFSHAVDLGESGSDFKFGYGRLFLGEVPENPDLSVEISPPAGPETTETGVAPVATANPTIIPEVGLAVPTASSAPTTSPEPVEGNTEEDGSDTLLVVAVLGTLACAGLAGLLLVAIIWLRISGRRKKANAMDASTLGGAAPEAHGGAVEAAFSSTAQDAPAAQPPQEGSHACPNCGKSNRVGAKFCTSCGFKF